MGWIIWLFFFFMVFGGAQMTVRLVEGRRAHVLKLKEVEARGAEAKVKELELEQQRAELEYRKAQLELERFDRRLGNSQGGGSLPPLPSPPEQPTRDRPDPPQ